MTERSDRVAYKVAFRLIQQLATIRKMPGVAVRLYPDKWRPIQITPVPPTGNWWDCAISHFLSMDLESLIATGAEFDELVKSRRVKAPAAWDMAPLDVETIDDALKSFGAPQSK